MVKKYQKGFTLIELLVVISIIGMMSSIVMAAVNSARDKGKVAAGLKFSTHTFRSFGAEAIGYWDFDEAGTAAPLDRSGNNYHFTQGPTRSSATPNNSGYAVDFSTVALNSTLVKLFGASFSNYVKMPAKYSYSAWVKPTAFSNPGAILILHNQGYGWGYPGAIFNNVSGKVSCDPASNLSGVTAVYSTVGLELNKWNHVLCSYDGTRMSTYINGQFANYGATFTLNTTTWSQFNAVAIGNYYNGSNLYHFRGYIDDAGIFSSAITGSEAARIYAEGLEKRQLASND